MNDRILIVDDEIASFGFLPDRLEDEGYRVVSVQNAEQGLKLAEKTFFPLVFMDFNLLGMNGLEAFRELRKISPLSAVVIMTAGAPEHLLNQALREGIATVLYKPFKIDKAIELIDDILRKPVAALSGLEQEEEAILGDNLKRRGYRSLALDTAQNAASPFRLRAPDVLFINVKNHVSLRSAEHNMTAAFTAVVGGDGVQDMAMPPSDMFLQRPLDAAKIGSCLDAARRQEVLGQRYPSILVVEDDYTLGKTLTVILQENYYAAIAVGSGEEAIEEIRRRHFDAILVDFRLPDMSGIDVIQRIKEIRNDGIIIMMTAYESLDIALSALKERVFDFLIKPVDPSMLLNSLRKGLNK